MAEQAKHVGWWGLKLNDEEEIRAVAWFEGPPPLQMFGYDNVGDSVTRVTVVPITLREVGPPIEIDSPPGRLF